MEAENHACNDSKVKTQQAIIVIATTQSGDEKIAASVVVLTRNSLASLSRMLECIQLFDEVVVVDGWSTDGTRELANSNGYTLLNQVEPRVDNFRIDDFSRVRNIGFNGAKHDYILMLDSDELCGPGLIEAIRNIIAQEERGIWQVQRHHLHKGVLIRSSSTYPDHQARFCHRSKTPGYGKPVHERLVGDRARFRMLNFEPGKGIVAELPGASAYWSKNRFYDQILLKHANGYNFSFRFRNSMMSIKSVVKALKYLLIRPLKPCPRLPLSMEIARICVSLHRAVHLIITKP